METEKALYAGAGIDTEGYTTFPEIKLWIAFDSQPKSEFGDDLYPGIERPNFIKNLDESMLSAGFNLELIEGNIRQYGNSTQTIRYHTNTPLPSSFESPKNAICRESQGWKYLYVSGHDPRDCVLFTVGKNPIFIGNKGTCYLSGPNEREYDTEVTARLWDNNLSFSEYWFGRNQKFKTWEEFIKYAHPNN